MNKLTVFTESRSLYSGPSKLKKGKKVFKFENKLNENLNIFTLTGEFDKNGVFILKISIDNDTIKELQLTKKDAKIYVPDIRDLHLMYTFVLD
ncbi:MAG: hypothetical protein E7359_03025 [Clostridiales bacterium]|nr:hypothetical protein [Clostridiales bacterium]